MASYPSYHRLPLALKSRGDAHLPLIIPIAVRRQPVAEDNASHDRVWETPQQQLGRQPAGPVTAGATKGGPANQAGRLPHRNRLRAVAAEKFLKQRVGDRPADAPTAQLGPDAQRTPAFIIPPRPRPHGG